MGLQKKLLTPRQAGIGSGIGRGSNVISGDKQLMKLLKNLRETAARRVNTEGCVASAKVLSKAAKSEVPSNMKKAKQGIAWRRLKVKEARDGGAKVGGKVGRTAKKARRQNATLRKKSRSGRRGVGISGSNIHWLFLGAGEPAGNPRRETGKSGGPVRDTGNMEPVMRPMLDIAKGQRGAMMSAYKEAATKQLAEEVQKGKAF